MQEQNISTTHVLSSFSLARIELTEKLFGILIPVLNELHQTHYSDRFWKLMTKEYVNSVISKQTVLSSGLLRTRPETEPSNSFVLPTFKMRLRLQVTRFIRFWRSRSNRMGIRQMLTNHDNLTISLPDLPIVKEELGHPLPTYYPYLWSIGGVKRKRVENMAMQFKDVYTQNIIRQLPGFLIEHFDAMINSIPLLQPEKKSFHVHNFHSLYNTLVVALYIEKGAKLYWYQHGAYYGELIGHNAHYLESSLADTFRTWGWKIRENDEPWKAYRLEKFKKAYESGILGMNDCLLICAPRLNNFNKEYYQNIVSSLLLSSIREKYERIVIRPRPGFKEKSPKAQFNFIRPTTGITIDDASRSMTEWIKDSKLVIQLTVPSTNFLECIYIDRPTMALLHNEQPTDVVRPYYDYFLEVGVLHTSVESMVKLLCNSDLTTWWDQVKSSDMYNKFKREFTNSVS